MWIEGRHHEHLLGSPDLRPAARLHAPALSIDHASTGRTTDQTEHHDDRAVRLDEQRLEHDVDDDEREQFDELDQDEQHEHDIANAINERASTSANVPTIALPARAIEG